MHVILANARTQQTEEMKQCYHLNFHLHGNHLNFHLHGKEFHFCKVGKHSRVRATRMTEMVTAAVEGEDGFCRCIL